MNQLIKNHTLNKMPIVSQLSGPMSLTGHISKVYDKIIYVFGEYHGRENECNDEKAVNVNVFIKDLFRTTDVFIDFYHEVSKDPKLSEETHLDLIAKSFNDCLKDKKMCPLGRYHYTDMRNLTHDFTFSNEFGYIWFGLQHLRFKVPSSTWTVVNHDTFINLLNRYFNSTETSESYLRYTSKNIDQVKMLSKELDRTYPKGIGKLIRKFLFQEEQQNVTRHLPHLQTIFPQVMHDVMKDEWSSSLDFLANLLVLQNSSVLDVYLLARIFKKFKLNGDNNKPETPHNIIIYAGNAHAERCRSFFRFLGFEKVASATNVEGQERCLEMSKFPQPFFRL